MGAGHLFWYVAFSISTLDWNSVPGQKLNYVYDQSGSVYLTTFYDSSGGGDAGYTLGYTYNGYLYLVYCYVNTYLDYYSSNQKRSLTGHELGHGLGLGHILNPAPQVSLMGYNPDGDIYYVPQPLDIDLVNYVYP